MRKEEETKTRRRSRRIGKKKKRGGSREFIKPEPFSFQKTAGHCGSGRRPGRVGVGG